MKVKMDQKRIQLLCVCYLFYDQYHYFSSPNTLFWPNLDVTGFLFKNIACTDFEILKYFRHFQLLRISLWKILLLISFFVFLLYLGHFLILIWPWYSIGFCDLCPEHKTLKPNHLLMWNFQILNLLFSSNFDTLSHIPRHKIV